MFFNFIIGLFERLGLRFRQLLMRLGVKPEVRLSYEGGKYHTGRILDEKADRYLVWWVDFWGHSGIRRTGWVLKGTSTLGRITWPVELMILRGLAVRFVAFALIVASLMVIQYWGEAQYATCARPGIPYMGRVAVTTLTDGHYELVSTMIGLSVVIRHDPGDKDFSYIVRLPSETSSRFRVFEKRIVQGS